MCEWVAAPSITISQRRSHDKPHYCASPVSMITVDAPGAVSIPFVEPMVISPQ